MSAAANPRKKRATKPLNAALFYVAPTTPFIPRIREKTSFSVKSAPTAPSVHVVDLRNATANRPFGTVTAPKKKERPVFSQASVPRTISNNPDRSSGWNLLALPIAFARFLFAAAKFTVLSLGRLVILPLTAGFAIYDRFDADKSTTIEPEIQTPKIEPRTEPSVFKPRTARAFSMRRALISFAGTSLAIILPLQGLNAWKTFKDIKTRAETARNASISALSGGSSLADAQKAIGKARESVDNLGKVANALLERAPAIGGQFRSGKALLQAGDDLSTAAVLLSKSLDFMDDGSLDLAEKIAKAEELAKRSAPLLSDAAAALDKADDLPTGQAGLPVGIENGLESLRNQVTTMRDLTEGFLAAAPSLRSVLGETQPRRYMVIFQNNAELRPTGGFIGSFAVVDIDRGNVKRVEVPAGGSYDLQGSLKSNVLAPEPLRLISSKWEFQDGNWFPDFKASADKLSWFYSRSGGPTVDGVIALNAPVLARLLDAVGPVNMPAYRTVATGTTVLATAQEIVESPSARESGKPKQFIADLLPLVLAKITSAKGDDGVAVLKVFSQALEEKDIQISMSDPAAQAAFSHLGWTGELAPIPQGFDSLSLVRTNIAGGKTDAVIAADIRHESAIAADGTVTDHVTVSLKHEGKKGDKFTGVRNVSYLRLYVPEGSKLIKAGGDIRPPAPSFYDLPAPGCAPDEDLSEITGVTLHDPSSGTAVNHEFGRTAFGVWTQTDPGATTTVTFDYTLPFKVTLEVPNPSLLQQIGLRPPTAPSAAYGLMIGKQSGAENTSFSTSLKLPAGWYPSLASPSGIAEGDGWSYGSDLHADQAIGMIISQ